MAGLTAKDYAKSREMTEESKRYHEERFGKIERFYCERCDQMLDPKTLVWLELSNTTTLYHKPGELPEGEVSQGCFTFGRDCARKLLKETEKAK